MVVVCLLGVVNVHHLVPQIRMQWNVENGDSASGKKRSVLNYGSSLHTNPITVMKTLWGPGEASDLPSGFPRILKTTGSEGNSTASVFATVKDTNEIAIINYDGGARGGRAVLSRVCFEDSKDEESTLALLTNLLSQSLGIDCTRSKAPEFTAGYLLGDDENIKNFLADISPVIKHSNLTIEFVPAGMEGFKPSHKRTPLTTAVGVLECTNYVPQGLPGQIGGSLPPEDMHDFGC